MTPEEKLLRAIFGEKASDVRDTSLRLPPGDYGTVVEVRVFNRHGVDKDERALQIEREEVERHSAATATTSSRSSSATSTRACSDMVLGKTAVKGPKGIKAGSVIDEELLGTLSRGQWWQLALGEDTDAQAQEALHGQFELQKKALERRFEDKVEKVRRGDDLPPGVMKMVKVFIAVKRKLQPGDKMAGRHGNKGVISKRGAARRTCPSSPDGTPGRPRAQPARRAEPDERRPDPRDPHGLGRARPRQGDRRRAQGVPPQRRHDPAQGGDEDRLRRGRLQRGDRRPARARSSSRSAGNVTAGVPIATPVFDGAKEADVNDALQRAGFDTSGQSIVFDGRSGEQFTRPVTVGVKYLLKLHHLVDDKIHARSTGPYSLVTQQPLGGKAQFGGQRFGEMEVWALEAYGAAYTLQEMLTVKSDDVAGRTKVYESIVKGEDNFEAGVPESFNVLVKEIRSLGLNIELLDSEAE